MVCACGAVWFSALRAFWDTFLLCSSRTLAVLEVYTIFTPMSRRLEGSPLLVPFDQAPALPKRIKKDALEADTMIGCCSMPPARYLAESTMWNVLL